MSIGPAIKYTTSVITTAPGSPPSTESPLQQVYWIQFSTATGNYFEDRVISIFQKYTESTYGSAAAGMITRGGQHESARQIMQGNIQVGNYSKEAGGFVAAPWMTPEKIAQIRTSIEQAAIDVTRYYIDQMEAKLKESSEKTYITTIGMGGGSVSGDLAIVNAICKDINDAVKNKIISLELKYQFSAKAMTRYFTLADESFFGKNNYRQYLIKTRGGELIDNDTPETEWVRQVKNDWYRDFLDGQIGKIKSSELLTTIHYAFQKHWGGSAKNAIKKDVIHVSTFGTKAVAIVDIDALLQVLQTDAVLQSKWGTESGKAVLRIFDVGKHGSKGGKILVDDAIAKIGLASYNQNKNPIKTKNGRLIGQIEHGFWIAQKLWNYPF